MVATTTLGTTLADFFDRSLGIEYTGGALALSALLLMSLLLWYRSAGTVSVQSITTAKAEAFYWSTILFSQTLGTALGDWVADTDRGGLGLGYEYGAVIFGGGLIVLTLLYFSTQMSRVFLFWAAFVLTRPLGATLGDWLDKPFSEGGMHVSRYYASGFLAFFIILCIFIIPQRAERRADTAHPARSL